MFMILMMMAGSLGLRIRGKVIPAFLLTCPLVTVPHFKHRNPWVEGLKEDDAFLLLHFSSVASLLAHGTWLSSYRCPLCLFPTFF